MVAFPESFLPSRRRASRREEKAQEIGKPSLGIIWLNDDDDTELLPIPGQTIPLEQETAPAAAPDYSKHKIVSQRNLEDFARLWINLSGLQSILTAPSSTMQIGLKWQTGFTGTPAINIYLSADTTGSSSYLTSGTAAQTQLAGGFNNAIVDVNSKKTVDTTGTFIFPAGYWSSLTQANPTLHLLFEGAGAGAGQLILVLLDQNGNEIGTGPGVWFDLKNIKSMYQQFRATPATLPRPFDSTTGPYDSSQVSFEAYPGRPAFQQPANEEQKVLVFVNGSNETYEYSTSVAETVFKRLWWQGYKGRLVSFRWETLVGPFTGEIPAHYNLNEWLAWNWGKGLKDYLISSSAPSGYTVNVAAHSLGNTVVASALRLGMQASNVVLLQGAIPAGCFDTSGETNGYSPMLGKEIDRPTPDFAAALGYRGFVTNPGSATIYNFYNTQDYALFFGPLDAWEGNQKLNKPDPLDVLTSIVPNTAYDYDATTSGTPVDQRGRLFDTQSISTIRFVATHYESMSFIARSRSKALGADEEVHGVIATNINIGDGTPTNLGNVRSDHSGEFSRPIQQLDAFYKEFIKDIGSAPIQ